MSKLQLIYIILRALFEAPRMKLHTADIEYSYEMAQNFYRKPWNDIKKDLIFHKLYLLIIGTWTKITIDCKEFTSGTNPDHKY